MALVNNPVLAKLLASSRPCFLLANLYNSSPHFAKCPHGLLTSTIGNLSSIPGHMVVQLPEKKLRKQMKIAQGS